MIAIQDYAVYLVTDEPSRYLGDFVETVEAAIEGGVTVVQYRDTESSGCVRYERALRLKHMLQTRKIPLIINDYADLAVALGAAGVHLGQSDMPVEAVRRVIGKKMTLGLSITCVADIATVTGPSVDYVGIGPIYDATKTKHDAAPEMGLEGFSKIRKALSAYPAVAIGGITLERADGIYAAGADGLAIVSALSKADSPCEAARGFCAAYNKRRGS